MTRRACASVRSWKIWVGVIIIIIIVVIVMGKQSPILLRGLRTVSTMQTLHINQDSKHHIQYKHEGIIYKSYQCDHKLSQRPKISVYKMTKYQIGRISNAICVTIKAQLPSIKEDTLMHFIICVSSMSALWLSLCWEN